MFCKYYHEYDNFHTMKNFWGGGGGGGGGGGLVLSVLPIFRRGMLACDALLVSGVKAVGCPVWPIALSAYQGWELLTDSVCIIFGVGYFADVQPLTHWRSEHSLGTCA